MVFQKVKIEKTDTYLDLVLEERHLAVFQAFAANFRRRSDPLSSRARKLVVCSRAVLQMKQVPRKKRRPAVFISRLLALDRPKRTGSTVRLF